MGTNICELGTIVKIFYRFFGDFISAELVFLFEIILKHV